MEEDLRKLSIIHVAGTKGKVSINGYFYHRMFHVVDFIAINLLPQYQNYVNESLDTARCRIRQIVNTAHATSHFISWRRPHETIIANPLRTCRTKCILILYPLTRRDLHVRLRRAFFGRRAVALVSSHPRTWWTSESGFESMGESASTLTSFWRGLPSSRSNVQYRHTHWCWCCHSGPVLSFFLYRMMSLPFLQSSCILVPSVVVQSKHAFSTQTA